jgi:hypothetical protein
MVDSTHSRGRGSEGYSTADMAALAATVTEKLSSMAELSAERAKTTDTILQVQQTQQAQISQLVTDMAVLKTQHASFWKGVTVLFGSLSLIGGAIGYVIAQVLPFIRGGP